MSNPKIDEYRKLVDKIPDFEKKITEFAEQLGQTDKQPQEPDSKAAQVTINPNSSNIMKASIFAMIGSPVGNTPISKASPGTKPTFLAIDSMVDPTKPNFLQN